MSHRNLLVEIGTEELPPKSLETLRTAFETELCSQLSLNRLSFSGSKSFATPRRLAVVVEQLLDIQPDEVVELLGPPRSAAFDADGKPTPAGLGFARKCGVDGLDKLSFVETDKGERLVFREQSAGRKTEELLASCIEAALNKLPIAKRMRWGSGRQEFVRPVHWVVLLFGDQTISTEVMGLNTGNLSRGHRTLFSGPLHIESAATYENQLLSAKVMADPQKRQAVIVEQVRALGSKLGGTAVIEPDLLQEVNALVEWPVALSGAFDESFLAVPEEALVSSMGEHQKYFHVVDGNKKLMARFITVSNIESTDPSQVIEGNQRVIRPRLADAKFFYETDLKTSLESRRSKLEQIVFQAELGSLADKSRRVSKLGQYLAKVCGADAKLVSRAAELAKCDLVTDMVLEFDHLQGTMGRYYALAKGESEEVALAIYEQYLPKHAGDKLPSSVTGTCLALAERLDTLVGIFGIGQPPTGSRDPFALRRASLGVLNILVANKIQLGLAEAIGQAYDNFDKLPVARTALIEQVREYLIDRFRAWFEDEGTNVEVFRAVRRVEQDIPYEIYRRVQALQGFADTPAAKSLALTNKRVVNILGKAEASSLPKLNPALFEGDAESELSVVVEQLHKSVPAFLKQGDFVGALNAMASLKEPLETFFEAVMVMADDKDLQMNRLALLTKVRELVLTIADLSELSG